MAFAAKATTVMAVANGKLWPGSVAVARWIYTTAALVNGLLHAGRPFQGHFLFPQSIDAKGMMWMVTLARFSCILFAFAVSVVATAYDISWVSEDHVHVEQLKSRDERK